MRMKKLISVLLIVLMCFTFAISLGEDAPATEPLSAEAVRNAIGAYRETALKSECLSSDPSEDTENDESWVLTYDFGSMSTSSEKLNEESVIYDITVMEQDQEVLPGMKIGMLEGSLLSSFRNDNVGLAGDYYGALIYLDGDPEKGFNAAFLSREGQRNAYVLYQAVTLDGEMYDNVCALCFIDGGVVSAIELFAADRALSPEDAVGAYSILAGYSDKDDYIAVTTDFNNGTELEPFSEEDLFFSGIDFLNATSAKLPNRLDESYIDNGDGTYLHKVVGEGYSAIFAADQDGNDLCVDTITIVGDNMEGPRSVRVGDGLIDDQTRFRYEDTEYDYENMTQLLYGTRGTAPYGLAEYHTDGTAELTYTTVAEDNMTVMLRLEYSSDGMTLTAITVKIL